MFQIHATRSQIFLRFWPITRFHVFSFVLWCTLRFSHKHNVRFVSTPTCFVGGHVLLMFVSTPTCFVGCHVLLMFVSTPTCFVGGHVLLMLFVFIYVYWCPT